MPTIHKIATVNIAEGAKTGTLTFEADPQKKIKFWGNAPFRYLLIVGAESEAKFETVQGKAKGDDPNDRWPDEKFLANWGGVASGQKKPFGGGGGGFKPAPRPEYESLSIMSQVAVKEACNLCVAGVIKIDQVAVTADKLFTGMVAMTKDARGQLA